MQHKEYIPTLFMHVALKRIFKNRMTRADLTSLQKLLILNLVNEIVQWRR